MPTSIWRSINYKTPIKYFANTYIREYDLSKANINSLLFTGRINREEYLEYLNMDKQEREVKIGLWIKRDPSVYKSIQKGIIAAKQMLCETNSIEDYEVVSVKNDAMFIVGRELSKTVFGTFEFKVKNVYNVYMQLENLEIYYGDTVNDTGSVSTLIDVKGISDSILVLHQGGMLDLICDVCYKLQREDIRDTVRWLGSFYSDFVTRKLPKQYYRNFDSFSGFTINTFVQSVSVSEITDDMINAIDINRNLSILRDLMSIVVDMYNRQIH